MRHVRFYWLALAVLSCFSLRGEEAAADPAKLKPEGYLSDFAHVVDTQNRSSIVQYCGNFERATGVQIALVTLPTLGDQAIEDFSAKLFHNWGIGQKGSSEGVMLLLVINDRKSRVEVGYGLEQYLPDGMVGLVLRGMRPQLQTRDYGGGLLKAAANNGRGNRQRQERGTERCAAHGLGRSSWISGINPDSLPFATVDHSRWRVDSFPHHRINESQRRFEPRPLRAGRHRPGRLLGRRRWLWRLRRRRRRRQ